MDSCDRDHNYLISIVAVLESKALAGYRTALAAVMISRTIWLIEQIFAIAFLNNLCGLENSG